MVANFYILAESFQHNGAFTNQEIEVRVKRLSHDVLLINQYRESNKLFTNYKDIYPQIFYSTYTVFDFLCTPQVLKQAGIDRDVINALLNIFQKSDSTTITSAEVKSELLSWIDENTCHGLIAFHKVPELDESLQLVYDISNWYSFRRHFLGLYPKDGVFFIEECKKYFPSLFFHERNKITVTKILECCSQKIVSHLAALNDQFRLSEGLGYDRTQTLKHFSTVSQLDEVATLEGNAERKPNFTFEFSNSETQKLEGICCEPHMKLCWTDKYPGDSSYSNDRRIYFHEGRKGIENGRILVGHIGEHL